MASLRLPSLLRGIESYDCPVLLCGEAFSGEINNTWSPKCQLFQAVAEQVQLSVMSHVTSYSDS